MSRTIAALAVVVLGTTGCAWLERCSVTSAPGNVAGGEPSARPALSQAGRARRQVRPRTAPPSRA